MATPSAPFPQSVPRIEAAPAEFSVVIPVFNEEHTLPLLLQRVTAVLDGLGAPYELLFVDDGSRDRTLEVLREAQTHRPEIRVVELSRNFGKEIAVSAGLDHTSGRAVVVMDADLQDPPELIPELLEKWREGYDAVYATRRVRHGESWLKRSTASLFYYLLSKTSDVPIPRETGDFRVLDRSVVETLRRLPEHNRFMKGLFAWVGFRQTAVYFDRPARAQGSSKWNLAGLWRLSVDGFTSFSSLPLKIAGYVGMLVSLVAFAYSIFLVVRTIVFGVDVPGYASLMVVILFLGGLQLFTLGVVGEYLGRVFIEVKRRPLYVVRRLHGFGEGEQ
ncbi:MAG TPA: glycosyltransferase family 2 protein [bacterium]|nr:glycosyltransferase family 2 protein [bacterium]